MIAAGTVAGLIVNVIEIVTGILTSSQYTKAVRAHDLPAAEGFDDLGLYVAVGFATGWLLAWTYAAFAARYGQGTRSGLLGALVVWSLSSALPSVNLHAIGLFPAPLVVKWSLMSLIALVFASLVVVRLSRPLFEP